MKFSSGFFVFYFARADHIEEAEALVNFENELGWEDALWNVTMFNDTSYTENFQNETIWDEERRRPDDGRSPPGEIAVRRRILCGGNVSDTTYITSPEFDLSNANSLYPNYRHCEWLIQFPEYVKSFTITPTHFEIEDHPLCLWDTLSIYTSKKSDGTYNKTPHYFFCGSMTDSFDYYDDYDNGNKYAQIAGVTSRVMNKAITIEGNHAKIDFISDSQVGKRGFRLHIEKPELCPNDFWEPNHDCKNPNSYTYICLFY